jgi:hypothetical protein
MIPTHSFSKTKKTKYFGVEVNGQFVKLQSKKATANLFEAVVMENKPLTFTKNAIYETNTDRLITKITRLDSYKLFNYLNNTNLYNVKSNYSTPVRKRNHQHSDRQIQSNSINEKIVSVEIIRAITATVDCISDSGSKDCVSIVLTNDRLQHGSIESARDFRILPSDPIAYYTRGIPDAIKQLATDFFNGEPGSDSKMQQLRDELDFSLSRNLIDAECYKIIEGLLESSFNNLELERDIDELDQEAEEIQQRIADTEARIIAKTRKSNGRKQQSKTLAKKC